MELSPLFVLTITAAFLLSLAANRWLRIRAPRLGLIDWPGDRRRVHTRPTAVVGGPSLLIAIGFTGGLVLLGTDLVSQNPRQAGALLPVAGGAVAMFLVGLWDDRQKLPSSVKFAFQVGVATAVAAAGLRIASIEIPLVGVVELADSLSLGITVFWLVSITNAFNLVDGTDGLAAGAAFVSILAMFVASLALGHELVALVLGITGAATLGFLSYNFPPASVFLGDSGSQMLGFLLGGLGVVGATKAATTVAIVVPVLAFGLPVLDTALAILRRLLRGESIAKADRGHIHHRLIDLGHSPRTVVLLLYGACAVFGAASLASLSSEEFLVVPVCAALVVGVGFGIRRLRIPELVELQRLWGRRDGIREQIHRNVRIRDRARELRQEESLPVIFTKLAGALSEAGFDEVELWIHDRYLKQIPSAGGEITRGALVEADEGFSWSWQSDGGVPATHKALELRAPVLVADEELAAEVKVRRSMTESVPDDLEIVSESLLPAAARALENARESNSVSVARAGREARFSRIETADTRLRTASG